MALLYRRKAGAWQPASYVPGAPGPVTDRDALVLGNYLPGPTTTGITDTNQTLVPGNMTYSGTSTQVIENLWFQGMVYLTGSNKTFRNCIFEGPLALKTAALVATYGGSYNNLITDCTLKPRAPGDQADSFIGRGVTLRRCNISGGVDGIGAAPEPGGLRVDLKVEQCWVHDLSYWCPSTTHSDGLTHNDVIQWHGGAGLTVRGNNLTGFVDKTIGLGANTAPVRDGTGKLISGNAFYPNSQGISVVMCNSSSAQPGELLFEYNWMDAGGVGFNMLGCPLAWNVDDGSKIQFNWFGYLFGYGQNNVCVGKPQQLFTFANNYRWNTANPLDTSISFNTRAYN